MAVFWDVVPCSMVEIGRRFRGAYCFHHQSNIPEDSSTFLFVAVRISILYLLTQCIKQLTFVVEKG
jgi:hypothetical protein